MPASHLKCHLHVKSVSLSCCGNLSSNLPGVTKGPFVSQEARSGCGDILFSPCNKGAHGPLSELNSSSPIMPAQLTTTRGETRKRNPLFLASSNQSCWFVVLFSFFPLFLSLRYLLYKTPCKGPQSCFCREKHQLWGLFGWGMKLPILIESPKLSY